MNCPYHGGSSIGRRNLYVGWKPLNQHKYYDLLESFPFLVPATLLFVLESQYLVACKTFLLKTLFIARLLVLRNLREPTRREGLKAISKE